MIAILHDEPSAQPTPMEWSVRRLGSFCLKIGSGATPKGGSASYQESRTSYALIRSQNVYDRHFDETGLAFISDAQAHDLRSAKVQCGDVLLNITGDGVTFARSCLVPESVLPACVNQHVAIIRVDQTICDPGYLLAFLTHPLTKPYIESFNTGGSRRAITKGHIESFNIPLPPIEEQRRIAAILSAYDDLIENCRRRIQILEEMARNIYREWFVHFRYPGHESIPLVASPLGPAPYGWIVKEMREVADVIDCLHSKKPEVTAEGEGLFLQLANIGDGGRLDLSEEFRISREDYARWTSRIELQQGDCVVTNVGRVGAVAQIPVGMRAAPGRNMTAVRAKSDCMTPSFLISYLLSSHFASEVAKKKDAGTIMDSLNVKGIVRLHVLCPPNHVMNEFESKARPLVSMQEKLTHRKQLLKRHRDLLLPRLLSAPHQSVFNLNETH